MRRDELAIEQCRPAAPQRRDQPGQRDLRGIRDPAEHALAAKYPVKTDAVEAADQFITLPALQRMGMAKPVQVQITRDDPLADPALATGGVILGLGGARRGAGLHDFAKGFIAAHAKAPAPQGSRQRARAAEVVERQDRAGIRLDPEYVGIIPAVGHRKDAAAIGEHQQLGIDAARGGGAVHRAQYSRGGEAGQKGCSCQAPCQLLRAPRAYRSVAQLVEHRSPKPSAGGSNPSTPAIFSACGRHAIARPALAEIP